LVVEQVDHMLKAEFTTELMVVQEVEEQFTILVP
jgi:hypothetical protein